MRILTGEEPEDYGNVPPKNQAAAELGRNFYWLDRNGSVRWWIPFGASLGREPEIAEILRGQGK